MSDHRRTRADRRPLPTKPGATGPRRSAGRRVARKATAAGALFAVVTALAGAAGGTTLALYSADAVNQLRGLNAGDLELELGGLTWLQVTPGVKHPATGDATTTTPAGFKSMPGDVFELRVPATTLLQGDNLAADLEIDVDYAPAPTDHPITATYHVEDESGAQVAPATAPGGTAADAPVGTPATLADLTGDDAGATAEWTIVIRAEVTGDERWVTPSSAPSTASWNAGTVSASLKQVRPWEGTP